MVQIQLTVLSCTLLYPVVLTEECPVCTALATPHHTLPMLPMPFTAARPRLQQQCTPSCPCSTASMSPAGNNSLPRSNSHDGCAKGCTHAGTLLAPTSWFAAASSWLQVSLLLLNTTGSSGPSATRAAPAARQQKGTSKPVAAHPHKTRYGAAEKHKLLHFYHPKKETKDKRRGMRNVQYAHDDWAQQSHT